MWYLTQAEASGKTFWRREPELKLERQVGVGLIKEGRANSMQRGREETQEEQDQKPGECCHFRAGLRTWGPEQSREAEELRGSTSQGKNGS